MSRLFLDANIVLDALLSKFGLSKAVISLCAARIHRAVLSEYVIGEIENNLLIRAARLTRNEGDALLDDYEIFVTRASPEVIPAVPVAEVLAASRIIKHLHDAPVLAAAIRARPDWLLHRNRKHFNKAVAERTGLRLATPKEFFRAVHAAE